MLMMIIVLKTQEDATLTASMMTMTDLTAEIVMMMMTSAGAEMMTETTEDTLTSRMIREDINDD